MNGGSTQTFNRKGNGRIYTNNAENIERIKEIIKEMDEFEYDYLPDDLITVFKGEIKHVYTHKFDSLDLDELMRRCWNEEIYVFVTMDEEYTP